MMCQYRVLVVFLFLLLFNVIRFFVTNILFYLNVALKFLYYNFIRLFCYLQYQYCTSLKFFFLLKKKEEPLLIVSFSNVLIYIIRLT